MHCNGGVGATRVVHDAPQRRRPTLRLYGAVVDVADNIEDLIIH